MDGGSPTSPGWNIVTPKSCLRKWKLFRGNTFTRNATREYHERQDAAVMGLIKLYNANVESFKDGSEPIDINSIISTHGRIPLEVVERVSAALSLHGVEVPGSIVDNLYGSIKKRIAVSDEYASHGSSRDQGHIDVITILWKCLRWLTPSRGSKPRSA